MNMVSLQVEKIGVIFAPNDIFPNYNSNTYYFLHCLKWKTELFTMKKEEQRLYYDFLLYQIFDTINIFEKCLFCRLIKMLTSQDMFIWSWCALAVPRSSTYPLRGRKTHFRAEKPWLGKIIGYVHPRAGF